MTDQPLPPLRPREFSQQFLNAWEAAEGRRKRRKRDTTPDTIGLQLKRELLLRTIEADPAPDEFEAWLLQQALSSPASGPARAMCAEIFDEYRFAAHDPGYTRWLLEGAHSADAEPDANNPA